MNKEKMGKFIAQLRKEKSMTQKDLAEQIHLTDKAVSKWERGLSFPDISMLEPLADILDVSVLELLEGERVKEDLAMTREEAEQLIDRSISISDEEITRKHVKSKTALLACCICLMLLASIALNVINFAREEKKFVEPAYATRITEDGTVVFVNEKKAMEQLLSDIVKENAR